MPKYVVRTGVMRILGVHSSGRDDAFQRGAQVVVRTDRGVEIGEVLCEATEAATSQLKDAPHGQIMRATTAEDARATLRAVLGHEPRFVTLVDPDATIVNGKFGTTLFPETWIIDPRGVIRVRIDGGRDWSSSLALDVARMVGRPEGCGIAFERGRPRGDRFAVCGDAPGGS